MCGWSPCTSWSTGCRQVARRHPRGGARSAAPAPSCPRQASSPRAAPASPTPALPHPPDPRPSPRERRTRCLPARWSPGTSALQSISIPQVRASKRATLPRHLPCPLAALWVLSARIPPSPPTHTCPTPCTPVPLCRCIAAISFCKTVKTKPGDTIGTIAHDKGISAQSQGLISSLNPGVFDAQGSVVKVRRAGGRPTARARPWRQPSALSHLAARLGTALAPVLPLHRWPYPPPPPHTHPHVAQVGVAIKLPPWEDWCDSPGGVAPRPAPTAVPPPADGAAICECRPPASGCRFPA